MPPARRIDFGDVRRVSGRDDGRDPVGLAKSLLDRLEAAGGAEDVIAAIRAVGTSRPVTLAKTQKLRLLDVCAGWLNEVGEPGLPDGIFELRNALIDERYDGELDDDDQRPDAAPGAPDHQLT
jgi:hypothetical protein